MLKKLTLEQQQFATENHNLIYSFLQKNNLEIDDWYGISAYGFCKAVRAYNKDKNVCFSTFAYKCMQNEILMEYRKNKKHKGFVFVSLETSQYTKN